jgi:hypothetical protein
MSDSLSRLQRIENRRFDNPLVLEILTRVHDFLSDGRRIAFPVTWALRVTLQ